MSIRTTKSFRHLLVALFAFNLSGQVAAFETDENECALSIDTLREEFNIAPATVISVANNTSSADLKLLLPSGKNGIPVSLSYYACVHVGFTVEVKSVSTAEFYKVLDWIASITGNLDMKSAEKIQYFHEQRNRFEKSGEFEKDGFYSVYWETEVSQTSNQIRYDFKINVDGAL